MRRLPIGALTLGQHQPHRRLGRWTACWLRKLLTLPATSRLSRQAAFRRGGRATVVAKAMLCGTAYASHSAHFLSVRKRAEKRCSVQRSSLLRGSRHNRRRRSRDLICVLQAAPSRHKPLHLQTAFDPMCRSMKLVVVGDPFQAVDLLETLQLGSDGVE